MLHNRENEESQEYVHQSASNSNESAELDQDHSDSLEDYLDQICAPLVGSLPRSKREEIRERVRQRLQQFAAAHSELGSTPNEAIELAIAQCGAPELISARWLPHDPSQSSSRIARVRSTSKFERTAIRTAGLSTLFAAFAFGIPYFMDATRYSRNLFSSTYDLSIIYYRVWLFAIPLAAGLLTGITIRRKPVRGVVNVIAMLSIPAILIPGLAFGLASIKVGPDLTQFAFADPLAGICGLGPWLVLGCTGAALGQGFRKAAEKVISLLRRGRVSGKITSSTI